VIFARGLGWFCSYWQLKTPKFSFFSSECALLIACLKKNSESPPARQAGGILKTTDF